MKRRNQHNCRRVIASVMAPTSEAITRWRVIGAQFTPRRRRSFLNELGVMSGVIRVNNYGTRQQQQHLDNDNAQAHQGMPVFDQDACFSSTSHSKHISTLPVRVVCAVLTIAQPGCQPTDDASGNSTKGDNESPITRNRETACAESIWNR